MRYLNQINANSWQCQTYLVSTHSIRARLNCGLIHELAEAGGAIVRGRIQTQIDDG